MMGDRGGVGGREHNWGRDDEIAASEWEGKGLSSFGLCPWVLIRRAHLYRITKSFQKPLPHLVQMCTTMTITYDRAGLSFWSNHQLFRLHIHFDSSHLSLCLDANEGISNVLCSEIICPTHNPILPCDIPGLRKKPGTALMNNWLVWSVPSPFLGDASLCIQHGLWGYQYKCMPCSRNSIMTHTQPTTRLRALAICSVHGVGPEHRQKQSEPFPGLALWSVGE